MRFNFDHKEAIQELYCELANERYDKEYWELPQDVQDKLYKEATEAYIEQRAAYADYLKDEAKYRGMK